MSINLVSKTTECHDLFSSIHPWGASGSPRGPVFRPTLDACSLVHSLVFPNASHLSPLVVRVWSNTNEVSRDCQAVGPVTAFTTSSCFEHPSVSVSNVVVDSTYHLAEPFAPSPKNPRLPTSDPILVFSSPPSICLGATQSFSYPASVRFQRCCCAT